jgi:hypothetical protein
MKDMGYWQKSKARPTPAVNQPADCIRENYTIRRATNSLSDAQNFAEWGRSI